MSSITKTCSVNECFEENYCKDYCDFHYHQLKRTGKLGPRQRRYNPGLRFTSEYKTWKGMRSRCASSKTLYGKLGITVCDRWSGIDGFENFILDMDWKPSDEYTLDRIDNSKGYIFDNCRWATVKQQSYNRRKLASNKSGYTGVIFDKRYNKWYANFWQEGVTWGLGYFNDPELAAIEYDKAVIFFRGDYGVTNIL